MEKREAFYEKNLAKANYYIKKYNISKEEIEAELPVNIKTDRIPQMEKASTLFKYSLDRVKSDFCTDSGEELAKCLETKSWLFKFQCFQENRKYKTCVEAHMSDRKILQLLKQEYLELRRRNATAIVAGKIGERNRHREQLLEYEKSQQQQ